MGDHRLHTNGSDGSIYREVQEGAGSIRLITEVQKSGLRIWFEPTQVTPRTIRFEDIEQAVVARTPRKADFSWRWGIAISGSPTFDVYQLSSGKGVRLDLVDDSHVFVGSARPAELRHSIISVADLFGESDT